MGTVCAGGLGSKRARAPGRYLRYLRKVGYLTARRGTIVPIAVREVAVAAACVRTCPTKPTGAAVQLEIVPRPLARLENMARGNPWTPRAGRDAP